MFLIVKQMVAVSVYPGEWEGKGRVRYGIKITRARLVVSHLGLKPLESLGPWFRSLCESADDAREVTVAVTVAVAVAV